MDETNNDPEFDGECAFAVSLGKTGVDGSAKHQVEDGDKVYHFSNPVARLLWKVLPGRPAKATDAWAAR